MIMMPYRRPWPSLHSQARQASGPHRDEVDLKVGTVAVYRSVRVKGDTKTRNAGAF